MPHIVKLTEQDQILLLNQLALNYEYKADRKLRRESSIRQMSEYYIDAAEKIRDNYIEVRNTKNNFFLWLRDQFAHGHSSQYHSADGQEADLICLEASKGHYDYDQRLRRCLFEICP